MISRVYRCRNCDITLTLPVPDSEEHKLSWTSHAAEDMNGQIECPKCFQRGSLYPLEEVSL